MYNFYNDVSLFKFSEPRQNIKDMKFAQKLKLIKKLYMQYTFINYAKTSKLFYSVTHLNARRSFLFFFTAHKLANINVYNFFIYFFYKLKKFKLHSFVNFLSANNFFIQQQTDAVFFKTGKSVASTRYLNTKLSIHDYFFNSSSVKKWNKNSRRYSMEEIITHFIFYSEGFTLPAGIGYGGIEAPKGHLCVSIISQNSNKPARARIKSSIQNMMGQLTQLVEGTQLGDFVVIVSGSYVVVGEVDR